MNSVVFPQELGAFKAHSAYQTSPGMPQERARQITKATDNSVPGCGRNIGVV